MAMASLDIITPIEPVDELPIVRTIGLQDLRDVLAKGIADFWAMPTHVVFVCMIYPIAGLLIGRATFGYEMVPLLYPLAAGFALLGPFAAIGLYELSRRREAGMDTAWNHAFDVVHSPSFKSILGLGLLLLTMFIVWIAIAHGLYVAYFGPQEPAALGEFLREVLTTKAGFGLIVAGNLVGFVFAVAAMAVSVISFPLLLDRHVSIATAILTSLKVVMRNPVTMAAWGLIVAISLALGSLPLFMGLVLVVPILGHSTWHLYRKAVEPDAGHRPTFNPAPKGRRYAAEFPSSLFASSRDEEN
jgi:uncharacterized membrane protein